MLLLNDTRARDAKMYHISCAVHFGSSGTATGRWLGSLNNPMTKS